MLVTTAIAAMAILNVPSTFVPIVRPIRIWEEHSTPASKRSNTAGTALESVAAGSHTVAFEFDEVGGATMSNVTDVDIYISVKRDGMLPEAGGSIGAYYSLPDYGGSVYREWSGSETVYSPVSSSWSTNGTSINAGAVVTYVLHHASGPPTVSQTSYYGSAIRTNCYDASVDSRKSYGQPNEAGVNPGDANAPFRPINFGGWHFKGGLNVGKMPSSTGDRSGTARIQFFPSSTISTTNAELACLTVYSVGTPSGYTGSATVGIYKPNGEHSALSSLSTSAKEMAVTWDTKWSITPGEFVYDPENPSSFDPSSHAYETKSISTSGAYYSFSMSKTVSTTTTSLVSGIPSIGACLALFNESSTSGPLWRYFASREWEALLTSPIPDRRPRFVVFYPTSSFQGYVPEF